MKHLAGPEMAALRDDLEAIMAEATDRAVKRFITRVLRYSRGRVLGDRGPSLSASAVPSEAGASGSPAGSLTIEPAESWLTYGKVAGWWAEEVPDLVGEVTGIWQHVYAAMGADPGAVGSSLDPASNYLAKVRDRLVQGITPPLPEAAFDAVRKETAWAIGQGLGPKKLAENIAMRLDWDQNRTKWQDQYDTAARSIDSILDPLGEPGSAMREKVKATNPMVKSLQERMSDARKEMDRGESYWKTRASAIARTETTGATNFAAISALADEGVDYKKWVATEDARTRPSHAAADGQSVELDKPFIVGGSSLQMPCDPTAPAREVVNCRCTVIGDWDREDLKAAEDEAASAPTDAELLDSEDLMRGLSEEDLEALMERQVIGGDFVAAERVNEIFESEAARGQFPEPVVNYRSDPDKVLSPDVYEWFGGAKKRVQDEFMSVLDDIHSSLADEFSIQQMAYVEGRSAAKLARELSDLPTSRQLKADYSDWLDRELLDLENATNGQVFKSSIRNSGTRRPKDLYSVNWATARSWASEETLQYWQDHGGRMTFEAYAELMTGNTGAATERRLKNGLDW